MRSKIESILFVASKALSMEQIAKVIGAKKNDVQDVLIDLVKKYNESNSGIVILSENGKYQMASNPNNFEVLENFIKVEITNELTRAQLETLTLVAYRGPITRPELEQIRGVNCAVILRNLLIRDLIVESEDKEKALPAYSLSIEALRHLGIKSVKELPNYESLAQHEYLEKIMEDNNYE